MAGLPGMCIDMNTTGVSKYLEIVAEFDVAWPSGVAVSRAGRIFVDDGLIWPDAVALGPDRIMYVTSSQLNRAPAFTGGVDGRERPFRLFRAASDADPAGY